MSRRRVRNTQPQGATQINRSNKLGARVLCAYMGGRNVVNGIAGTPSAIIGSGVSSQGVMSSFGGWSYLDITASGIPTDFTRPVTIAYFSKIGTSPTYGGILSLSGSTSFNFVVMRSTSSIYSLTAGNSANYVASKVFLGAGTAVDGTEERTVITCPTGMQSDGFDLGAWINGASVGSTSPVSFSNVYSGSSYLGWDGIDSDFNGLLDEFVIFDGVLTDAQIAKYYANPNQIFQAPRKRKARLLRSVVTTPVTPISRRERKRVRNSQPQYAAQVDPIFARPKLLLAPSQRLDPRLTATGTPTISASSQGSGWQFGTGNYFSAAAGIILDSGGVGDDPRVNYSLSFSFVVTSNAAQDAIWSLGSYATDGGPYLLLQNNSGTIRLDDNGWWMALGSAVIGKLHTVTITYSDIAPYTSCYYLDGVLATTETGYRQAGSSSLFIGSGYPGQTSNAKILQVLLVQGAHADLSDGWVKRYADNPWQLFQAPRKRKARSRPAPVASTSTAIPFTKRGRKRVRNSQPQQPTPLDGRFAANALLLVNPGAGKMNAINNDYGAWSNTNEILVVDAGRGLITDDPHYQSGYYDVPNFDTAGHWSTVSYFSGVNVSPVLGIFQIADASESTNPFVMLQWGGEVVNVYVCGNYQINYILPRTANNLHCAVITYDGAAVKLFVDGVFAGQYSTTSIISPSVRYAIGDGYPSGALANHYLHGLWQRAFSDATALKVSANPWGIFQAPRKRKARSRPAPVASTSTAIPFTKRGRKKVRNSQPQQPTQIDPRWASSCLLALTPIGDSSPLRNTVTLSDVVISPTPSGLGFMSAHDNLSAFVPYVPTQAIAGNKRWTLIALQFFPAGAGTEGIIGLRNGTGSTFCSYSGALAFYAGDALGFASGFPGTQIPAGLHCFALSSNGDGTGTWYQDGASGSVSGLGSGSYSNTTTLEIMNWDMSFDTQLGAYQAFTGVFSDCLPDDLLKKITAGKNPWQLFQAPKRRRAGLRGAAAAARTIARFKAYYAKRFGAKTPKKFDL